MKFRTELKSSESVPRTGPSRSFRGVSLLLRWLRGGWRASRRTRVFTAVSAVLLLCLFIIYLTPLKLIVSYAGLASDARQSVGGDAIFRNVDEAAMPPVVIRPTDQVCALCTDGLVYVHVGRAPHATERVSAAPVLYTVAEEVYVQPAVAPVFTAGGGFLTVGLPSSSEVVSRCLAQLISLGQLGAAVNESIQFNGTRPEVTAAVVVDFDTASPRTSAGLNGSCPAFLTEVRPVASPFTTARMDVAFPRLPSWPLPSALNAGLHGGGAGPRAKPPVYFGTAMVRETDADKDVQPPLSVELAADGGTVRIGFGHDAGSTRPEAFEMACPSHFLSVFVGRWGRHNNQLQELMHTLAFSRKVDRTFIVPAFVPEELVPFLRYDAQKMYGFNALRREGGYCLVTYAEARAVLKQLEAKGVPMSLRRFNYDGSPRPIRDEEWREVIFHDWWHLPVRSANNGTAAVYNVDAWLEDSRARDPPVTTVQDVRADGMNFLETEMGYTVEDVFPSRGEQSYVRMARLRKSLNLITKLIGGDHRDVEGAPSQPRLAVFSSRMAFYLRPSLREQTRIMGLLRPAESIAKEVDRFYAKVSARFKWPGGAANNNNTAATTTALHDTLRPSNFKHVIGFHIRRREGYCRSEALNIGGTSIPIDNRFQMDRVEPSWSSPLSTVKMMELDCALTATRVMELYRQYTRFMRHNMTGNATEAAQVVPTVYMAYDYQSGTIAEDVDRGLLRLLESASRTLLWGRATTFPEHFVSSYDKRIINDFRSMLAAEKERLIVKYTAAPTDRGMVAVKKPRDAAAARELMIELINLLYEPALTEMVAMVVDYFMLTNVGMFRGVTLSSVSENVMMRRWGRGLPCHAVLAGYQASYYPSMWFDREVGEDTRASGSAFKGSSSGVAALGRGSSYLSKSRAFRRDSSQPLHELNGGANVPTSVPI